MARPLRVEYEGALYHLTSRGNGGENVFFKDADRIAFLELLGDAAKRFSWICHAYCLMENHYHLIIETPKANLSRGMRHINGVFTQRSNKRRRRSGHLFQGRFKSILVEKDSHLLELARYVALNPVRARIVRSARDWRWSSYRATAGLCEAPPFLTTEWILSQFSLNRSKAQRAYRKFVREGQGVPVWDGLRHGWLLGTESLEEALAPLIEARRTEIEFPRVQRLVARPTLERLFTDASDKERRNSRIHEALRVYEYTLKEVAVHLGLHYSTVSTIAKRIDAQQRPKGKT